MRVRLLILLLFIFTAAVPKYSYAQEVTVKRSTLFEYYKGKPYYIHFVQSGETLTAIAKAYNVTVAELSAENSFIDKGLKADMVLRIPQKTSVVTPETETIKTEKAKKTPVVTPETEAKTEKPKKTTVVTPEINVPYTEKKKDPVKSIDNQDYIIYLVQKQETLYGISRKYNMTVDDILSVNPGFEGLKEGMELRIPKSKPVSKPAVKELTPVKVVKQENSPAEIIVKTGETLYSISKLYNTSVDNLIEWNPQLTEGLKAGMVLRIRKPDEKSLAKPEEAINPVNDEKPLSRGDCYKSSNIKATYQIALLLPLLLDEAEDVLSASEQKDATDFEGFNYFQFYAGFMLAADSLEKYGLNARIQVMDADKLNDTLTIRQALRKPGMDKMDLLVGPMYGSSFTIASRFAQKHKIGIINPLSRRESIVEGNPYVIKTQASGSGVAKKLASFITNTYPDANIIAVRNDTKEMKTLADEFISQVQDHIDRFSFSGSLQESVYATEMMNGVTKKLKAGVKNIVILFSNNKTTVPNFVSLLNPHAKTNDIILMGMDGWEELDLETEFLVNLNFHQLTSSYIDYESEATQQFVTRFKNKYGALPQSTKHAFLGYDLGWYFLTSLMWNGDQFISCLPGYRVKGLQYNFNFAGSANGDGIQNQDITIVKLQDYKLIKVE